MGQALKWIAEQKLPLVLSAFRGEASVAELDRRDQGCPTSRWRSGGTRFLAVGSGYAWATIRRSRCRPRANEVSRTAGGVHMALAVPCTRPTTHHGTVVEGVSVSGAITG